MVKPTQEQVIQWAREAGYLPDGFGFGAWDMKEFNEAIALAYKAGRKDENEACAKVCDEMAAKDKLSNYYQVAAIAIRTRREQ